MSDSEDGSSDEEGAYLSAAEELSLSPTPHNYETPLNSEISGDSMEERREVKGATEKDNNPEESDAPSDMGGDEGEAGSVQPARSCQADAVNPDVAEDSGAEQTETVTTVEKVKKKKKEGQVMMRESTTTPTQVTVLPCNGIEILKNL